ncbi:sensor domain-containing phosphodiesterase [Piscibacillus halophilus]|uniref:EAL domain, c-di-GMP-specific phosphodiesterase class I (Or its enzymatically inactive variant) n=1 Tax=Piscibacillus halophilus TaxID=571933 RepID=A0A1H9FXH8_9BACI|nr:EAL domain-containing protein [Piscibacillus halophilus]SEQ42283.1 EAL domain, c-di-GMP-specific phosphodiesterase class I (or its enzymatically inactive variant) [Piscibacillus halophilus]
MGEKSLLEERVLSPEEFVAGYQYITEYLKAGLPLCDVLKRALKYFEDQFVDSYCTIMLLNSKRTEFVNGTAYSLPDDMLEKFLHIRLFDGLGTFGAAAVRGELMVTPNVYNDKSWKTFSNVVEPYGLKSCWSVPVFKPGTSEVVAVFGVYSKYSRYPTQRELDTLAAYNELLGLIISNYKVHDCGDIQPLNQHQEDELDSKLLYAESIKTGLKNGDIFPYYQPVLTSDGQKLHGVEALARWEHPEKGLVPPIDFIDHAEEYDFIDWLDEVICRRACEDMKQLMDLTGKKFMLSVNISAVHIRKKDFAQRIETILHETGFPANYLSIEITETSLIENLKDVAVTFQHLKSLGVKISIDDFGTTYSSLNYLKYLPVDTIKLDKAFIHDVDKSPIDRRICKTIIQLGCDLNLDVIAEGVESTKHLTIIRDFGCDIYQGYYFSKPLTLEGWKDYLEQF